MQLHRGYGTRSPTMRFIQGSLHIYISIDEHIA